MFGVFSQFYSYIDDLPSPWNIILKVIFFVVAVAGFIFTNFKMVAQGDLAMKTRFGKVISDKQGQPRIYKPGRPHWVFPWLVKIESVSVLTRQVEFTAEAQLDQYTTVQITATANLAACDIFKIRYTREDFEPFTAGACSEVCVHSMQQSWQGVNDSAFMQSVGERFTAAINSAILVIGVCLESLNITKIASDPQMAIAHALANGRPAT